jgi:hypothetical protein
MTLLDEGKTGIWGDTFTEDAIFVPPNGAPEVQGRAALKAGMEAALAGLWGAGIVRRHMLTNLNVVALPDGKAQATAYVLIVDSAKGESRISTFMIMHDELHSDGAGWHVSRRVVRRDIDGPPGSQPANPG